MAVEFTPGEAAEIDTKIGTALQAGEWDTYPDDVTYTDCEAIYATPRSEMHR